jgi:hypothetical protein
VYIIAIHKGLTQVKKIFTPHMKNIIPHNSSILNEEVMSTELKNQFLALQHLHSEQESRSLHHNTPSGSNTCLSSLSTSNHESMDDEEDHNDSNLISTSSSESSVMNLAVSTAMKAQHEIDSLMRGITELERMLKYQTENSENIHTANKHSQLNATNEAPSIMNIVDQEDYD